MKRRQWLKWGAGVALGALGTGTLAWHVAPMPAVRGFSSIRQVREQLERWRSLAEAPLMREGWSSTEVLVHCAQSIEYSLVGFPELKAAWFRASLGPAAFATFDRFGAMHHNLQEPIPGAPDLTGSTWLAAVERLDKAWRDFEAHQGSLAAHFAYGELDHRHYTRAHLMHFAQHMDLLST